MNKFLALMALCLGLCLLSVPTFAEEVASMTPAASAVAESAAVVATPIEQAVAVAAAPVPDKGDTSWMMLCTLLVIMMSIPGLALFYGGLVRSKNMLSILMQVFSIFAMITVLWAIYGYSLAFTEGNAFIGGLDRMFLKGIFDPLTGSVANAATFSKGVVIPEFTFVAFQATFAAITVALIVGAFAERMKFSAVMLFSALWFTFAYLPIAHMVWFWAGPDAYTSQAAADAANATAGWLFQKGALDFAGGTVVHINAAIAGLVGAFMVGKRVGYGKESMAPHNLVMTMIGASLLWVGWFGFNAGSALEAGGTATLAFANTLMATAAAVVTWLGAEWLLKGKPSLLGAASGAVAGLVAITPACGWVGVGGGLVIGALAGVVCFWGVTGLKKLLGADDALDVFGIHGIGGILGALLTGVFNNFSLGGTGIVDYVNNAIVNTDMMGQLWIQAQAVLTTVVWSGLVAFICYKLIDMTIGLRVTTEEEREGLDTISHGERAYNI
ncbi:MAG: ammonium transporter [Gallionella sp.]|nr:ammonium transporter [Gallionella sp.]MDD4945381.1 ammonium transporter [Gallionella sp.]